MSDIIDDIDNLARDERDLRCEPNGSRWLKTYELLCAELVKHWPALSARLREAERKYEEMFVMHHLGANIIHHEDGTFEGYVRTTNTRVTGKTAHELRVAIEYALAAGKGTT